MTGCTTLARRARTRRDDGANIEPLWFEWLALGGLLAGWYCKGVGLVKVVRAEPANSTFLAGGTMTLELTEWQ